MSKNKIVVSVAPIKLTQFCEAHVTINPKEYTVEEIAQTFALMSFGSTPFVFASFPAGTERTKIQERMVELWDKYKNVYNAKRL